MSVRKLPSAEGGRKPSFEFKDACLMLLLGAILGIGLNFVFSSLGITRSDLTFRKVADTQFAHSLPQGLLLYGLLAPILEEIVFRKGIYAIFRRYASFTVAMVISSTIFGLYHGNVVQGLYGFLMGLVLAGSYEEYHSLSGPILFHSGANAAVYLLFYLKPNF